MPHLLIVTGAPGSGKSWLLQRLLETVTAHSCTKDQIKETLFDTLGGGDAAWSRRLSDASFALMFQFAPQWLGADGLLILEGNFRAEHQAPLQALIEGSAARAAQVLCVAAEQTRAARLAKRASDHTRHPGHQDWRTGAQAGVGATFLELPGPRIQFDSESPERIEFTQLRRELGNWYPLFEEV